MNCVFQEGVYTLDEHYRTVYLLVVMGGRPKDTCCLTRTADIKVPPGCEAMMLLDDPFDAACNTQVDTKNIV